jgi:hypothetical protein
VLVGYHNKLTRKAKMKSTYLLLLTPLLFVGNVRADTLTADEYASAEKYIIESDTDWAESVVTGDKSRLKIYVADDFLGTGTGGGRYDKETLIRETGPSEVYVSNTINSIVVRFFGDTAVAYGDETWVKKDGSTGRWVWTDIWVRRNGSWKIVATQDVDAPVEIEK